ncbi:hypothetical protein AAE478_010242 [Parahypoxylon ruwenzoriense]
MSSDHNQRAVSYSWDDYARYDQDSHSPTSAAHERGDPPASSPATSTGGTGRARAAGRGQFGAPRTQRIALVLSGLRWNRTFR